MIGYIVKNRARDEGKNLGKIVDVFPNPSQLRRATVRFVGGDQLEFSQATFVHGTIVREVLPPGFTCEGPEGACTVIKCNNEGPHQRPYEYEVEYGDGFVAVVHETELEPLNPPDWKDTLTRFSNFAFQGYWLFAKREKLLRAYKRLTREAGGLKSLLSSRIDLHPHQAYVAGVVLLDSTRRYILADEVGLGKTIEAGVVMSDLLLQKADAKILVLCPSALTHQWLSEIYSKFGGHIFRLLENYGAGIVNSKHGRKIIVPISYAAYEVPDELVGVQWDLVVIDEAHQLLASPVFFDFVERLSKSTPSLLMLSAIPAQRREDEFLKLLSLLEPGRYNANSDEDKKEFKSLYAQQTDIGRRLRLFDRRLEGLQDGKFITSDVVKYTEKLFEIPILENDDRLRSEVDELDERPEATFEIGKSILHYIGDRYRINRRILRNRRSKLIEEGNLTKIKREINLIEYAPDQMEFEAFESVVELTNDFIETDPQNHYIVPFGNLVLHSLVSPALALGFFDQLQDADHEKLNQNGQDFLSMGHMFGYEDWDFYTELLCKAIKDSINPELLERTLGKLRVWNNETSIRRISTLVSFLKAKEESSPLPKILIFGGFFGVSLEVTKELVNVFGERAVTEFRFDLPQNEKEENVRSFLEDNATWILVSDETGGEGRNFQGATEIVHYDNPWHISKIEQRIGRLDRLGREAFSTRVLSNVIVPKGTIEHGFVKCLRDGLGVYQSSISGLEFALRDVEGLLVRTALDKGFDGLIELVGKLKERAETERYADDSEAVLDEGSFEAKAATKYRRISTSHNFEEDLQKHFVAYFKSIASKDSARSKREKLLPAKSVWQFFADDVKYGSLPDLVDTRDDTIGTFRRDVAQRRPGYQYFNVGNPFFDSVINSLDLHTTGRTYAVAFSAPGEATWSGFEFVFKPGFEREIFIESPGSINRIESILNIKACHVFVSTAAEVHLDSEELLSLRRGKGEYRWADLSGSRVNEIRQHIAGSWTDLVRNCHQTARDRAQKVFEDQLSPEIQLNIAQIDEQIRYHNARSATHLTKDVLSLQILKDSINNWHVQLDGIGFLSVNVIDL